MTSIYNASAACVQNVGSVLAGTMLIVDAEKLMFGDMDTRRELAGYWTLTSCHIHLPVCL